MSGNLSSCLSNLQIIPFQGLSEFCHFQLETTGVGLLEMIQGWVSEWGGGGKLDVGKDFLFLDNISSTVN